MGFGTGHGPDPIHIGSDGRRVAQLYHPQLGQTVNYEVTQIPDGGDEQTAAVIALMVRYAVEDAASKEIQQEASRALAEQAGLPPVEAVFWHVKRSLRFVRDEQTAIPFQALYADPVVETLIRPRDVVTFCATQGDGCVRQGDCDDFSAYTASLLLALGIPCKFVTVAADSAAPDQFSHVYVAAYPAGQRIALDTSHGDYPGWETKAYKRIQEWGMGSPVAALVPLALIAGVAYLCR